MGHAVQRHRQRHAGLEQVRQLLCERRQLLQPRFAFLLQLCAQRGRQERHQVHIFLRGLGAVYRAGFGRVHRNGEKAEALDLRDRR